MDSWRELSAAALGREIGSGRIDTVDLVETYLEAIETHPSGADIYARMTPDRARAEAEAARQRARAGHRRSPLDGVPVSWKDNVDTAGVPTEAGTALLEGRVPASDATVLRNATAAGLVCLGKTHLTELAFSGLGLNPITATPPCVNDAGALPGGSSSGAATSVAFRLAAAAVGSDTAGSVRLPASWNDLVGHKTSHGLLSLDGVVPLCPRFDTVGPLARTVEDAALMIAAMAGRPAPDLAGVTAKGIRLALLRTVAMEDVEPGPAEATEAAISRLIAAGAVIEDLDCPEVAEAVELAAILFAAEAYGIWGERIEAKPNVMFPPILERFRGGASPAAHTYIAAWRRLCELRRTYRMKTAGYDAVILPTCAIPPPQRSAVEADVDYFAERNLKTLRNTRIGSLLDLCGLTLPIAPSCGLLLQAPNGQDGRLLRLGTALERALS